MRNAVRLLLPVLLLCVAGQAAEPFLMGFELDDQFEDTHRDDDWRGGVVLLIGSDQEGSRFDAIWERAIRDSCYGLNQC